MDFSTRPQLTNEVIQNTDVDCIGSNLKKMTTNKWDISENFFDFSTESLEYLEMISTPSISFKYPINSKSFRTTLGKKIEEPLALSLFTTPLKDTFMVYRDSTLSNNENYGLYVNNDLKNTLSDPFVCNNVHFVTRNIPSMANVVSNGIFSYYLTSDFDFNSFKNLSTHNNINNLFLSSFPGVSYPLVPLSILLGSNDPNSEVMFSTIVFTNTQNFHINGELPFSKLPNNLRVFSYLSGPLKKPPNYKIFDNTDISSSSFEFNQISGDLPKWDGSKNNITFLDLSSNSITGTIDESYCSVELFIRNNSMTGKIPDCFTCHFSDDYFKLNFEHNLFDNFDTIGTCKTIPKLKYLNQTFWKQNKIVTEPVLSLMGQNIGYLDHDIVSNIDFNYILKSNSIIIAHGSYTPNRVIHDISFRSTGQKFTLTPDPYPPFLSNITSNNHILEFKGLYYSYNITEITIIIGGRSCDVTDSTFYQITCTLTTYPNQLNNVSGTIKVDQLQTKFNLNLDNNDGNEVFNNYTSCLDNCESYNGNICNYNTGICECPKDWTGENCFTPLHYVSSIIPTYEEGGLATMNGWFGDIHQDFNVKIGDQECKIDTISSNTITCNIGASTGKKDVTVYQNGITWKSYNFYIYQPKQKICLNNCTDTNHGICNTSNGICDCKSGWVGFDCSSPSNNKNNGNTNSTVNSDGSTTIKNDQTTYNILITSLLELDINSDTVKQYPLQNHWNIASNDKKGSNVTFTQILDETECQIVLSILEIENDIQYSFAGIDFKLDKGSIKVSISIHNYNYQSPLNTLQLQMISNVSDSTSNDCNSKSASTSTSILDNQTLNYISINKDSKILYGRFINRAISDGHTTLITTSLVSNQNESVTIGINIPHCRTSCYIDPDFSALINSNFKSNCDNSKSNTALIATLVSCIGVATIFILAGAFYLFYKKSTKTKVLVFKLKKIIKAEK
ncbi:hypothetical protein DICPUDRAFT_153496 [Dictyostelium purpureum]|uniref:EGF-like domain-containing protein n=1 Tax=Dictyostelium purpureum TaxID=5786 RepID=F0ZP24_DICPU|nr:uncharacterized protein DICPUDRAFT_153496 [Dictyostelium purpureum]EGC34294.1 hypothetical protein DICPUDRAFT_153496 [Dictyostelium purpureum]|eukprot:XP_003289176.1 hypothetical protein DICPUDRAFT_153496 [Dictyostelium purpureum]